MQSEKSTDNTFSHTTGFLDTDTRNYDNHDVTIDRFRHVSTIKNNCCDYKPLSSFIGHKYQWISYQKHTFNEIFRREPGALLRAVYKSSYEYWDQTLLFIDLNISVCVACKWQFILAMQGCKLSRMYCKMNED